MSRNGTPMQRLRDRTRVSVPPERVAYLKDRGLEVAVEEAVVTAEAAQVDVDGALDGTTAFTGLNVGGTDVKPFLDKTDGSKLTDSTGLDAQVVDTAAIAVTAVSSTESAFTGTSVSLNSTVQVLVQEFTIDVEDGDQLIVMAAANITSIGAAGGIRGDFVGRPTLSVYRGSTFLSATRPASVLRDMELHASASIMVIDTPPAGTHTIYLYSDLTSTTNVLTLTADNRFLGCLRRRLDR